MKHGPFAAKKHEVAINKRLELSDAQYDLVEAMMRMCGPNCVVTTRMYLLLQFGQSTSLMSPSSMKAVPPGYPSMLVLDVQHNENRAVGAHLSWVKKVREARMSLWGDAELDVCVPTVIALVREKIMPSVLSPLSPLSPLGT
jgi:hypothetical protein